MGRAHTCEFCGPYFGRICDSVRQGWRGQRLDLTLGTSPCHAAGEDQAPDFVSTRNAEREDLRGDGAAVVLRVAVKEKESEDLYVACRVMETE